MLNSETTSGLKDTVLNGLKALFHLRGGKKSLLTIEQTNAGFYIMDGEEVFAGPYKTAGAAKGQRTRYLKGYTPASRRPA